MEFFVGILNYLVFFAITAGIYAILSLGLNIQWGYTGLFNIGIAGFFAVGAYTSALLCGPPPGPMDWRIVGGFQLPFIVGLLGAAAACGIIALLIGIPVLRLKEDYLAIATVGIAEVIRLILKNESWLTNSVWGLKHIPSPLQAPIQGRILVFLESHPLLPSWLQSLISNGYSWFFLGLVLRAIREDEVVAGASGKNVFFFKMQSLVIGAMIMGIAGSFYAHYVKFIDANTFEPLYGTFLIWVMLIAGGSGNSKGAILGSFVIWGVWAGTDLITAYLALSGVRAASLRIIAIGIILEIILLKRPQGMLGEEKRISKMF